jgi:hypothetical protein
MTAVTIQIPSTYRAAAQRLNLLRGQVVSRPRRADRALFLGLSDWPQIPVRAYR